MRVITLNDFKLRGTETSCTKEDKYGFLGLSTSHIYRKEWLGLQYRWAKQGWVEWRTIEAKALLSAELNFFTCWYFFNSFWERMAPNFSLFWLESLRSCSVIHRWKIPTQFTHTNSTAFAINWEGSQRKRKGDYLDFDNPNPNPLIFTQQGKVVKISIFHWDKAKIFQWMGQTH